MAAAEVAAVARVAVCAMGSDNVPVPVPMPVWRAPLEASPLKALPIAPGTKSGRAVTVCSESGDSLDMAESVTSDAEPECSTQSLFEEATNCDSDEMRVDSGFPKYSHIRCSKVRIIVDLRHS